MYSILHFDVFNPRYLTHWLIAAYQLLILKERFWWVVHVGITFNNETELRVKCNTIGLTNKQPHDRELYWYPLRQDLETSVMVTAQATYFMNCARVVSLCTNTPYRYLTPSALYDAALDYTHDLLNPNYSS